MKKIAGFLVLMMVLCLCLPACRPTGSAGDENTAGMTTAAETVEEDRETQGGDAQLTMPEQDMPDKPEADYQLPPEKEPDVTVVDE